MTSRSACWNRLNHRVHHLDGLNRHIGTEAQPALGHRRIAHLRATLVGLGRPIVARGRLLHPEPGEEVGLRLVVELEALLRLLPQELALEPLELMLECIVLRLQLLECTSSSPRAPQYESLSATPSRAFSSSSLATSNADTGKRPLALNTPAIYSTLDPLGQPAGSASFGGPFPYRRLPTAPPSPCDSAPVSAPSHPGPTQTGLARGACSISSPRPCRTQESSAACDGD